MCEDDDHRANEVVVLPRETVELLIEGSSHLYECAPSQERAELIRGAKREAEDVINAG